MRCGPVKQLVTGGDFRSGVHLVSMLRAGLATVVATMMICPPAKAVGDSPSPPPSSFHYLQYGVAFAAETVASAGDICPSVTAPCILGSGFGPAIRVGYRSRGNWYVGGAYEFSRQDPASLLRLAILQQLRGEARYYLLLGRRMAPYAIGAVGGVLYGNEWGAETGGVGLSLGAGLEYQLSESALLGAALVYRALVLRGWTDGAGVRRADGFLGLGLAHLVAIEVTWEPREILPRW
jgi:hypothetical protein